MKHRAIGGPRGLHNVATDDLVKPVMVKRICPKCHATGPHRGNDGGVNHQIRCTACDHSWTGRVFAVEK